MTELSGTLDGVGLPAIVRFLAGLKKTGCLRVSYADWQGEVFFDVGHVTGARLGSRTGLSALDALVQALPSGSFAFVGSARAEANATIHMSQEVFDGHLDELASRTATGMPKLPPVDAVPSLVAEQDATRGDEPLALDRGTLKTLLAVNGERTVRDIVAQTGSFDALWQLRNLVEIGVVRLEARASSVAAPEPRVEEPEIVRPFPMPAQSAPATSHCPKVGFEDDPSNTFGRPTRLHRCFAAGTPQPLSLDQQRELCLSDHFGTCPRLTMFATVPTSEAEARAVADDPQIVRLPSSAARGATAARHGAAEAAPTVVRRRAPIHEVGAATRTTPLRAHIERHAPAQSSTAVAEPLLAAPSAPPAASREPLPVEHEAEQDAVPVNLLARRFRGLRLSTIGAAVVAMLVLVTASFVLAPKLAPLFADDSIDASRLPNSSAIAAGAPGGQFNSSRPSARSAAQTTAATSSTTGGVAQAAAATNPTGAAAQTNAASNPAGAAILTNAATNPTGAAASAAAAAASAAAARVQPTVAPTIVPSQAQPTAAPAATARTLLDENFAASSLNWPNDPQRTAWLTGGSYQLATREAGKFVAVSAPVGQTPNDVVVNATFRKLSGPLGGGYGIIVRDQGPLPQEGTRQDGRYYVLEVGDKGEVGIWRRESDHWVDVLPWQRSDAVKTDTAANDVTVRAIGNSLTLLVNGTQVATRTDDALTFGSVGLFVGGDGNQVAVEHFSVQTP